eukprot:2135267-Pleurochrysis_carterae.AAC.1
MRGARVEADKGWFWGVGGSGENELEGGLVFEPRVRCAGGSEGRSRRQRHERAGIKRQAEARKGGNQETGESQESEREQMLGV